MRKLVLKIAFALSLVGILIVGCKKESTVTQQEEISQATLQKISGLGFSNKNVVKHEDGYLVEGDIIVTDNDLANTPSSQFLRVGTEEQYRTYNLVTGVPRNITVSISSRLPSSYVAALDVALARYNSERLLITFTRVSSGGDISVVRGNGNYLASAGFPTSSGNPYSQVKVNSNYLGSNPNQSYLATIIAHELGHCIGFRHTDYMNRQYSCGGSAVNEGASTVGAVHIPGTPTGPDPNSWMLSCISSGQNRPFNSNDRTALNYLY